jgi:2-dehydropantoate 2-reductase
VCGRPKASSQEESLVMATGLPFMEPLYILGSGCAGLFWAASIRSAFPSYPLAVLFRSHHKSRIHDNKQVVVCMQQNRQRPRMAHVPAQLIQHNYDSGSSNKNNNRPIRNLILTTKAHQAATAVQSILPRLDKEQLRVIVLCNGALSVRDELQSILHDHNPQLVMATTTQGVYQEPPDDDDDMYHLVHVGLGQTLLGGLPTLGQLWDQSGLNCQSISPKEMEVSLWQKLAANCVCNPLTTLWELDNGKLWEQPTFESTMKQVLEEVSQVAQASAALQDQGEETLANDNLGPQQPQPLLSPEALRTFVEQVIRDNAENKSSMWHDVRLGRRTEVDNLNGHVVRKGQQLGVDCPANEELWSQIRALTQQHTQHTAGED